MSYEHQRPHIKAIETVYRGHRFRSRHEARWAVFFDSLGVDWVYEPEGFDLTEEAKTLATVWRGLEVFTDGKPWDSPNLNNMLGGIRYWSKDEIEWIEQQAKVWYLPDFWLPLLGKYIEIKPFQGNSFWGAPEHTPIKLMRGYLVHGEPATMSEEKYEVCVSYDNLHFFGHCDKCGTFDQAFEARNDYLHHAMDKECCGYPRKHDMTTTPTYLEAVRAARSARFEHGESGPKPIRTRSLRGNMPF